MKRVKRKGRFKQTTVRRNYLPKDQNPNKLKGFAFMKAFFPEKLKEMQKKGGRNSGVHGFCDRRVARRAAQKSGRMQKGKPHYFSFPENVAYAKKRFQEVMVGKKKERWLAKQAKARRLRSEKRRREGKGGKL